MKPLLQTVRVRVVKVGENPVVFSHGDPFNSMLVLAQKSDDAEVVALNKNGKVCVHFLFERNIVSLNDAILPRAWSIGKLVV